MNKLELPVGGVFSYINDDEAPRVLHKVRVVEMPHDPMVQPCEGCVFAEGLMGGCARIACGPHERTDAKNVKFLEVKGGEE